MMDSSETTSPLSATGCWTTEVTGSKIGNIWHLCPIGRVAESLSSVEEYMVVVGKHFTFLLIVV